MNQHYLVLRGLIRSSGLTIASLARKVGVSESHMNNILCVRSYPAIDLCYDIIRVVGADACDIYKLFPPGGVTPASEAILTTAKSVAKEKQNKKVIRIGRA